MLMAVRSAAVIVIQEHWLHSFENHELQEFLTDFNCFVKCSDDNEPIAPYQCPRGKPHMRERSHMH
jgi:hypothetical protein